MWQKIKMSFASFMQGRNGVDNLGMFTLYFGLALSILNMFLNNFILSILAMALYFFTVFRMFSRNIEKRRMENQRYIQLTSDYKKRFKQFTLRVKNRKQFKYFRCPKCRAMLRLTRGCGSVKVTCGRCHHEFTEKA